MQTLQTLSSYLKHKFSAIGRHDAHSPFLYDLIEKVFNSKNKYSKNFNVVEIEKLRKKLRADHRMIDVQDLGAGSKVLDFKKRKISDISKVSLKKPKEALLLLRLSKYLKCTTIIELGTSLGITTLYLSESNLNCQVYTLEGCVETSEIAKTHFDGFAKKNIHQLQGNFDVTLPQLLLSLPKVDMVLFDGNHARKPTIHYFNFCLEKINEQTVFVFDDINWSHEMQDAWAEICAHPRVSLSIDCWQMGMVFFHKNREKQHFKINC